MLSMASLSACLYLYLSVRLPICLSLCLCLCLCLPVPPASTLVSAGPESRVTCMTGNVASVLCMYECAFVCVRPWRTQTSCVSLYTRKPRTAYNYTARTHARISRVRCEQLGSNIAHNVLCSDARVGD